MQPMFSKTKTAMNNTTNEFENRDGMDNCLEKQILKVTKK